jgi:hypothetical protein
MRKGLIFLIFMGFQSLFGQNSDSLVAFALRNENFFRHQISRHYPLSEAMLDKYSEDWIWYQISQNNQIDWTENLLKKYRKNLNFELLLRNPKIVWTSEKIDSLGERADWSCLSQNPSLPLSKKFLKKYEKKINWHYMGKNPAFIKQKKLVKIFGSKIPVIPEEKKLYNDTQIGFYLHEKNPNKAKMPSELVEILQNPFKTVDKKLFTKFPSWWQLTSLTRSNLMDWDFETLDTLIKGVPYYSEHFDCDGIYVYQNLIKPVITTDLLTEIMLKLNPPNEVNFYVLKSTGDEFGIVQKAFLKDKKIGKLADKFPLFLSDTFKMPDLILQGYEPPVRFAPIHAWDYNSEPPFQTFALLISTDLKAILERFNLPPHRFYPVNIYINDLHYGSDFKQYFVLHIEKDQYVDLDVMVSDKYKDIWISDDVKNALEIANIGAIGFEKIRKSKPRMPGIETLEYRLKNQKIIDLIAKNAVSTIEDQLTIKNYRKKIEWRKEVLKQKGMAKIYRSQHPLKDAENLVVKHLLEKELEFEVIFPQSFISKKEQSNWKHFKTSDNEYEIFRADKLEQLRGWDRNYPFAAKSVLIGRDGMGNYIGFLLKEGSAFELDENLHLFDGDTGEIRNLGKNW